MSEAPRVVYVGFIEDKCVGVFVSADAARETVRATTRNAGRFGPRDYLLWSSEANGVWTLHMSDDSGTHQEVIAHIESVSLERRAPAERRRS